jgi:NAD(P)-dependent dehydrogenase (short-subunit alcohol dehydrogenase family)
MDYAWRTKRSRAPRKSEEAVMQQKVVVVTGASSGIGAAVARRLAAHGHRVFGASRSPDQCEDGLETLPLDVRDPASVAALVEVVLARAGRIDVLVNNAGVMLFGPVEEVPLDEAQALFETNFWGAARMVSAVLAEMRARGHGHIVNVGSVAGNVAIPMNGFYAATKHALAGYTEALRHEVMHFGVRVTLVEPGDVRSRLWRDGSLSPACIPAYASLRASVLRRVEELAADAAEPHEVANAISSVVESDAPPGRIRVGKWARLIPRMRAWMPEKMFEDGTRRKFSLDRL